MAINDKIRDEKLQCDINREAAKILTLYRYEDMIILQVKKYYLLIKDK